MLVITSGRATRQYGEGGLPSKTNWSKAVTRSADTITKPCMYFKIETSILIRKKRDPRNVRKVVILNFTFLFFMR